MAAIPINRSQVPPGGMCRYQDPDTGVLLQHPYYERLKGLAKKHRIDRNLPIPYNWEDFFDEQYCKATPAGCLKIPDWKVEKSPGIAEMAVNFTKEMTKWMLSGFKIVDEDTFNARSKACAGAPDGTPRCQYFTTFSRFGATKCAKCGCSGLKLYVATSHCPIGKW